MVDTIKFSEMTNAGDINNNNVVPGLLAGENVLFNNPWTFLPSGTTAERPAPSPTINYRLRFNTDDQVYEFYNAILGVWVQLSDSAIINGPFITYEADVNLPDAQNLGALADGILRQTISFGSSTIDIVPSTNFGVLSTDGSGFPSIATTLPANLTIPDPIINSIQEAVSGDVLSFLGVIGSVNHLNVANAGTGDKPEIFPSGADTDIGIDISGQGVNGISLSTGVGGTIPLDIKIGGDPFGFNFVLPTLTAQRNITFPDADVNLVSGTMANAPVNTNITDMNALTTIRGPSGNIVATIGEWPPHTNHVVISNGDAGMSAPAGIYAQGPGPDVNVGLFANGMGIAAIGSGTASVGSRPVMALIRGSANVFLFDVADLTATRTLAFPDADVTLVGGTMANAPINTNITEMHALTTIKGANGFNVMTFADSPAATDYFSVTSGAGSSSIIQLVSSDTNASFAIYGKGTGGVQVGSVDPTVSPFAIYNGAFRFFFSTPTLTANRILSFPDGNVTLTPGTMATTSQIVVWNSVVGTSQSADVNNGYVIDNVAQTTVTLPAIAAQGSVVSIAGQGAGGWILAANVGQTIKMAASTTSSGGSLTSAEPYDAISVVCVVADTTWVVQSAITTGFTIA